jgi:saccharopine dehydrogenase (NAD+, L-lysine-forming)
VGTVLIVGLGGVGNVVAHKCRQVPDVFTKIVLASRTVSRCEETRRRIGDESVVVEQVDADDISQVVNLIEKHRPDILVNTALPYQDLNLMEACLQTGVHYLDTANYEDPAIQSFSYGPQWALHERFVERGILGLLGSGFDPGASNTFIAYIKKHYLDEMHHVDIVDCNAGDHGHPFATNFNTEINVREVTQDGKYWENGAWKTIPAMSVSQDFEFPGIGSRKAYLIFHEEMESLAKHFPEVQRYRFWMTFSDRYLDHLRVLQNVGMTSIEPVEFRGTKIIPLQFLDHILPKPATLGPRTKGKTCIGCIVEGIKDDKPRKIFVYNICDHEEAYREVGSQAISYTTGVPAMIGAKLILQGKWSGKGVFCLEQLDPDPFMEDLGTYGLPWHLQDSWE